MLSKKLLAIATSLTLLLGSASSNITLKGDGLEKNYNGNLYYKYGGPFDSVIAREDKVIEMLKKEGKIPKDASQKDAHEAFIKYMNDKAKGNQKKSVSKKQKDLKAAQSKKLADYSSTGITTVITPTKTVDVLVLLIDYTDYKYTNIQPTETDMYYTDYNKIHYYDMIFGDNGYTGPNGQNLLSMKQYYAAQSGGSLFVQGQVAGWYTASQNAAYYGGNDSSGNDLRPRDLVKEALAAAAKDSSINLANFDKEDRYDADKDGNYNEPDGIIDYLMVIHAGVGEEAGGGSLGSNAIWSHRWDLGGNYQIPGTNFYAYDYTLEPEDGAAGVFSHEFGHDLGLPDEYDTQYSSSIGEPIAAWSIMSSGSWSGTIPGTEPVGFSPYAKQYFQAVYGGNWQKAAVVDFNNLNTTGTTINLRQASENQILDSEYQAVRINMPDRERRIVTPVSGSYVYWGGKGKDGTALATSMETTQKIALTAGSRPSLTFSTWYDIEQGWDYGSVQVKVDGTNTWTDIPGNITTTSHDPGAIVDVTNLITGTSRGWVKGTFDLSAYAGKSIYIKFVYNADSYYYGAGFYIDNIQITESKKVVFSDNADGTPTFTMNGFNKDTGVLKTTNYYLVEWRSYNGVDNALAHNNISGQNFAYDPGMVLWYVDDYYNDNWTGTHPGDGFLGIVDADQNNIIWQSGARGYYADNLFQMKDSSFSKKTQTGFTITSSQNGTAKDSNLSAYPSFTDATNYLNSSLPYVGRNIPHVGLKIDVSNQASDNSTATIVIKK